jgi:Ca-activated chloride channel family protein
LASGAALALSLQASAAGLLSPADGSLPPLEIKQHHVGVVIEDGYAVTTIEQVFGNPHGNDLEAIYSFPVPERAAVAEFTMWIDGKPVTGEVVEKARAREIYQQEKAQGRETGVTEKDAHRTFDIRVSPVRAGQAQRIRLVYIQPAAVDTGIGRYVYPLEEGGVDERKLAFWTANERVSERFSFALTLRSAYPVDAIRVASHAQAVVKQAREGEWTVTIDSGAASSAQSPGTQQSNSVAEGAPAFDPQPGSAAFALDQDVVVYWRHQAGLPGSVDLIAYKPDGAKRGTFMLVLTPGDDLKPIREGRDFVFVLDVSGSMQGKYATLADGVQRALGKMRPEDRFRMVVFNDRAWELTSGFVAATPDAVRHWSDRVAAIQPTSGTNVYAGVELALKSLQADRTSAIVFVTDGEANVGETRQRAFIDLVKSKDVRLFTFIMGNSANRPLLEAMTRASGGFAMAVSNSDDIVGQILTATGKVSHEALHGAKLEIAGVKTADLTPRDLGSLYRGQQLVVFGHYFGDGPAEIKLSGKVSGQPIEYGTRFAFPAAAKDHPEIERLWAFASIEDMLEDLRDFGEKGDLRQAVTDLAIEHGLVTDYTSMVVVREEQFERLGIKRQNRDRRALETQAAQQRTQAPVQSRRGDAQQPMFNANRPSHGGGSGAGAVGPWGLLLVLPLLWVVLRPNSRRTG